MRIREDTCKAVERAVKNAEKEVKDLMDESLNINRRFEAFAAKNNQALESVGNKWKRLGGEVIVRSVPFKLIRRGVLFLTQVDLLGTIEERFDESRRLQNQRGTWVRDADTAKEEVRKFRRKLERAEKDLDLKERTLERCRRGVRRR